jgi:small redox-active disulfide protein 2
MKKLQILGSGCTKCRMLADHTEQAARALGLEYTIEKVTDINDIVSFGIMSTPALVVDGKVKVAGRVPTAEAIKALLA